MLNLSSSNLKNKQLLRDLMLINSDLIIKINDMDRGLEFKYQKSIEALQNSSMKVLENNYEMKLEIIQKLYFYLLYRKHLEGFVTKFPKGKEASQLLNDILQLSNDVTDIDSTTNNNIDINECYERLDDLSNKINKYSDYITNTEKNNLLDNMYIYY